MLLVKNMFTCKNYKFIEIIDLVGLNNNLILQLNKIKYQMKFLYN